MELLKNWLLGVTAASLAVALAQAMTPEGSVKKVGRLVGGLVLLLAVAKPLLTLDPGALAVTAAAYEGASVQDPEKAGEETMKTLIARKTGAYIEDKGRALGCRCTARVTVETDENGWPVPWQAEIAGQWTGRQREELSRAIAEELEIPAERQTFREEGP